MKPKHRDRREWWKRYKEKCRTAINTRHRRRYKADAAFRKRVKSQAKAYYKKNKKKILARLKTDEAKKKARAKGKIYYWRHRDELLSRRKVAISKFPERFRTSQKRSALKRKALVMGKYGGKCAACGTDEIAILSIDHVNDDGFKERGRRRSGPHYHSLLKCPRRADLQVLCMSCQFRKRAYGPNPSEWKSKMRFVSEFM